MAEAVHLVEKITSAVSMNSTSFATRMTLSAAELGSAGFANNDEALVLLFAIMRQANTGTEQVYQVTYNGSAITSSVASPRIDSWGTSADTGRNIGFMGRVNLGTLADLDFDNQRQGTSANVFVDRATLAAIRLSDFGTENTDWWWNKSTTDVAHTTTYSGTNRASITFDAETGEDYVVFSYAHFAVDSVVVNFEGRVMLDGSTLVCGDYSEEGESTTEERTLFCWGVLSGLSEASHTVTFESRDDTSTASNNHRESALLIFKASQFPDLFYHLNSNTTCNSGTDTQVATVTDSLSAAQNALIIGGGNMDQNFATGGWLWVREGGSTVLTPATDDSQGTTTANWVANDITDELNAFWLGYEALSSGAQDLDLFAHQGDGSTGNHPMIGPRLLVWGLELGAGAGVTGTVAVTQGEYVAAASGTVTPPPVTGTVAVTLGSFVSAASGQLGVSGSAAVTLDPFTSAISGLAGVQGSVAVTLEDFVSAASGAVSEPGVTGTVAVTLDEFLAAAAGQLGYAGTVAVTLGDFVADAEGTHVPPGISGSVAVTLGEFTASATGQLGATGTAAPVLDDFVALATGVVVNPITGTVAVTLGVFVAVVTGVTYSVPGEGGQVGGGTGPADAAGEPGAASTVGAVRSARVGTARGIPGIGGGVGVPEVGR